MDICSDPSKLDRTCMSIHQKNVCFFLWSSSKNYVLLSFTVPLGFLLHFNGKTLSKDNKEKRRCDDIPWCFGSHPGPHAAQISHPEFSHSAEKVGDCLALWNKNRAWCSLFDKLGGILVMLLLSSRVYRTWSSRQNESVKTSMLFYLHKHVSTVL